MVYAALPDRRIPYDNDGTVVAQGTNTSGPVYYPSGADLIEWQDTDFTTAGYLVNNQVTKWYCYFPEQRELTGIYMFQARNNPPTTSAECGYITSIQGSNDSGNGEDGTFETASLPSGSPAFVNAFDTWRAGIKPVSFTGPKQVLRITMTSAGAGQYYIMTVIAHLYGEKAAGETPDDIIYINHDDTPGVEFTLPEDFGDQPLGTTVVRQFRIKNTSATKTANTINIQCNDSDFAISEDGVNWVVTINIASLSAGAESATLYVRCTTPAPGGQLGPRYARIVTTVASYT